MKTKIGTLILAVGLLTWGLWIWHGRSVAPSSNTAKAQWLEQREPLRPGQPVPAPASSVASQPAVTVPVVTLSNAPVSIRSILDRTQDFSKRYAAARSLRQNLQPVEVKALSNFLLVKHDEDRGQRGQALKNEVMDALCAQSVPGVDLGGVLAQLYRAGDQHVVLRDYAIQHLATLYERLTEPMPWPAGQIESQQVAVRDVLWEALAETDSSIAGTALLGLSRLAEAYPGFDRARIAQTALKLAQDESASELVRVTAMQVCAQMQVKEALPSLVQTAEQPADTSLRISAIAAIGALGGKDESQLLRRIAEEKNVRLEPALTLALRQVQARATSP